MSLLVFLILLSRLWDIRLLVHLNVSVSIFCLNVKFTVLQEEVGLEEETYEVCYNNACYEIGKSRWQAAQEKLKKAEGIEPNLTASVYHSLSMSTALYCQLLSWE
jgi:hypothetical protein